MAIPRSMQVLDDVQTVATPVSALRGTLGCGQYAAQIRSRGGGTIIADLPWTGISWERVLDATSTASIDQSGIKPGQQRDACIGALRVAKPWQHELAIFRNGSSVWVGPITRIDSEGWKATYHAVDLSAWLANRLIHFDHTFTQVDVATIYAALVTDAMSVDNSSGLTVAPALTGVTATRAYLAGQHLLAVDQLAELARTAVDWTMVGRTLLAGAIVPASPIVLLDDRSFAGQPKVSLDGSRMENTAYVSGAGGGNGDDPVIGVASNIDSQATYGVLEGVTTEESILDSSSATANATGRLTHLGTPSTVLDSVTLDPTAGVTIDQLVAGVTVGIALAQSGIPVVGTYEIQKVAVAVGAAESVALTFLSDAA